MEDEVPLTESRRARILTALGLAILTTVLYAQTLDDEWHFDDRAELGPRVRELSPRVDASHYRGNVVRWLWAIDWRISGDDPRGYHVTNVLLHFLSSLLVWRLARQLLGRPAAAAACAAIFCAHPLATQSVSYLTQRSTSLATVFFLLSLTSWIAFRGARGRRRTVQLAIAVGALAVGLHTKHVVVMVPAAIVAWEVLFRTPRDRLAVGAFAILALLAALRLADYVPHLRGSHAVAGRSAPASPSAPTSWDAVEYALTQPRSVLGYARLFVWPSGQNLDHDVEPVRSPLSSGFLAPVAILAAVAGLAWRGRRRHPAAAFGVALFFVALIPTSSVVRSPDLVFEHRAYLPLAGLCLALVDLGSGLAVRPRTAAGLAAVAVVALSIVTFRRNAVWDSELSLWSDVVAKSPGKARPRVNLALALQRDGRLDEAERHYRTALELRPGHAIAANNLGNLLRRRGRPDEAAAMFETALAARPRYAEPRVNLGNLAMDRGDFEAAERLYREAIELAPREPALRSNLAKALEGQGRWEEAIREWDRLVAERPEEAQFVNDRGCARLMAGDPAAAVRDLERAVALSPDWETPRYNLRLARRARDSPEPPAQEDE